MKGDDVRRQKYKHCPLRIGWKSKTVEPTRGRKDKGK
jgi:hypothetical protein